MLRKVPEVGVVDYPRLPYVLSMSTAVTLRIMIINSDV